MMLQTPRKPLKSKKNTMLLALLALIPAAIACALMLITKNSGVVFHYIDLKISPVNQAIAQFSSGISFALAPSIALLFLVWFILGLVIAAIRTAVESDSRFLLKSAISRLFSVSVLYLIFVLLFGTAYNAPSLSIETISFARSSFVTTMRSPLSESCENWIRLANFLRPIVPPTETSEILDAVPSVFANSNGIVNTEVQVHAPKPSGINSLLSSMMIEGIYIPFTGEALVNTNIPLVDLPFVACHEAAHGIGYAREDEANLVSMIVCGASQNPLFRYSGAMAAVRYSLMRILRTDMFEYNRLVSIMSPAVSRDYHSRNDFWSAKRDSAVAVFANKLNDVFLSYAGMQEDGVMSYEGVLDLAE
jgi:hypothetical protein